MIRPVPCTLAGRRVVLEPLAVSHAADLFAALAEDRAIWRWLPMGPAPATVDAMRAGVAGHLEQQGSGLYVAFAQLNAVTGRAVGVTNYLSIELADSGLEIGGTWLGRGAQRTEINREAKYLLLRHAFEELGAIRVQLKTDARNEQSQRAIAELGAVREGVLRKHKRCWDGYVRDSVLFSVTSDQWPAVKARLEASLGVAC